MRDASAAANRLWSSGGPGFSSNTEMWATPDDFYARLDAEFSFELDVCASASNAKCECFYTVAEDGLAQRWTGVCWMNPPYGRDIGRWMRKAFESARDNGATVVCLVPARTDTAWWHDWVMRAAEVRLVRGRLKFGDASASAPFPSAVVVFRPGASTPAFTTTSARPPLVASAPLAKASSNGCPETRIRHWAAKADEARTPQRSRLKPPSSASTVTPAARHSKTAERRPTFNTMNTNTKTKRTSQRRRATSREGS